MDEVDWEPLPRPDEVVGVRVAYEEYSLRQKVKAAGGHWNRNRQLWELDYIEVEALDLAHRIVREEDGIYVVEGMDGNFYRVEDAGDDGEGWAIGNSRWEGANGWEEVVENPDEQTAKCEVQKREMSGEESPIYR